MLLDPFLKGLVDLNPLFVNIVVHLIILDHIALSFKLLKESKEKRNLSFLEVVLKRMIIFVTIILWYLIVCVFCVLPQRTNRCTFFHTKEIKEWRERLLSLSLCLGPKIGRAHV